MKIIDIQERKVYVVTDYNLNSGLYQIEWNPGSKKGIFIARLKVTKGNESEGGQTIRMLVK